MNCARHGRRHSTFMRQPANANSWESNPGLELSRELEKTRLELACQKSLTERFLKQEQETIRQLKEAKQQLAHQTNLKEGFITKEKKIRDKFESMKRTCDPESLKTFETATEVHNNIKRTTKNELHHEFEQVKSAYITDLEDLSRKIQLARKINAALQQKVEHLRDPRPSSLSFGDGLQEQQEPEDMELLPVVSLIQSMDQMILSLKK
ncbi:hypothetical protein PBY51_024084 [Eleginops maclovinus]|uniref:Uncharacterized protein n=1 Tax=Eleginops maclovinus TaxID=56733 RepID=A0AAN7XYX9_ELEMC|nr:hypothetical protein PBY51_024084 [Eleginops maclovinus]